jgi:hypothetical protein
MQLGIGIEWIPDRPTFRHLEKGYSLHVHFVHTAGCRKGHTLHAHIAGSGKGRTLVHTAGGGRGYTPTPLHVHTAGGGKAGTLHPSTSILLAVEMVNLARPFCWLWKMDTPWTSILLAVERDTTWQSFLLVVEMVKWILSVVSMSVLLAVERDTTCPSILLAVVGKSRPSIKTP